MPTAASSPVRITFLVPGLLWPRPALDDTVRGLHLPALERMLRFGARVRSTRADGGHWWREAFGLEQRTLPAAALRLRSEGSDPGDREWVCLDPASIAFSQQDGTLLDPATLGLDADEDAALRADLLPLLAPLGDVFATVPGCWHLAPRLPLPALPERLEANASARGLIPHGEAAKPWIRALSEVQMQLHAHPVNRAREAAGRPLINSLAPWGAGCLPTRAQTVFDLMLSADPVHRGLAALAGCRAAPVPETLAAMRPEGAREVLVELPGLAAATLQRDALAWGHALLDLERDWIAPAVAAADRGQAGAIEVVGFGAETSLRIRYRGRHRLRLWRRAVPLTELHP